MRDDQDYYELYGKIKSFTFTFNHSDNDDLLTAVACRLASRFALFSLQRQITPARRASIWRVNSLFLHAFFL